MTEVECIHGIDPRWCSTCIAGPKLQRIPRVLLAAWPFTAQFKGECRSCSRGIRPGQMIRKWTDDSYRHSHHE